MPTTSALYPIHYFDREDEQADHLFYDQAPNSDHLGESAAQVYSQLLNDLLPVGGVLLDLMASEQSYLPDSAEPELVIGVGPNKLGMAHNPMLDQQLIQELNSTPKLPYPNDYFDAIVCTAAIPYLTKPIELFQELFRVLRPNGCCIISFSRRTFPTKTIKAWVGSDESDRIALVNSYFQFSAEWEKRHIRLWQNPENTQNLYILWAYKPSLPPQTR